MKILIVITKAEIGGAQVFVLNLASSLKKLGYDVHVAAGSGNYLFNELRKLSIPCHYLNSLKRNVNVVNSLYFLYDLYKILKKEKFDIVHLNSSNTIIGTLAAHLLRDKPKLIFTFHGLSFLDRNYEINALLKYFTKLYFKIFIRTVDKGVFVSRLNLEESKKEKIVRSGEVIFNGLDENSLKFIEPEDARKFFAGLCGNDLTDSFIIGSTGRLAYQKNYEFLINSFGRIKESIPEAKVVIMGDGPDKKKFEKMINDNNFENEFFFVGEVENSYQFIRAFDVFVLPSRYEGLSISLIEAVFAELPILTTDVGGNCEIVDNDYNQLFTLDNSEEFIRKLLAIKSNREKISDHNKKLKQRFSLEEMVKSYINIYK